MRRTVLVIALLMTAAVSPVSTAWAQSADSYKPHTFGKSFVQQAIDAYNKKDFAAAAALIDRAAEADPSNPDIWYNLACFHARAGHRDRALEGFERAVDSGWLDSRWPPQDEDLASLRAEPRFTAAVARIDANATARGPKDYVRRIAPMRSEGSYIVMLPPDYASSKRDYPLVIILHGNGSSELGHGKLADSFGRDGVIYVAVRAPYPSFDVARNARVPAFTAYLPDRIEGMETDDVARGDYTTWIVDVIKAARAEFRVAKDQTYIYGHSQGGHFAVLTALTHPGEIRGFLAEAGSEVPERWYTAERLAGMKQRKITAAFVHGLGDVQVPTKASEQAAARLRGAGLEVKLDVVEGTHSGGTAIRTVEKQWLADVVKRAK